MLSNVVRIIQEIASTQTFGLRLSTLKLSLFTPTLTTSSCVKRADCYKCILFYKKIHMANIFHLPPCEAMLHVWGLRYSSFRGRWFLADFRRRMSRDQNWSLCYSDIPNRVTQTKADIQLSFKFSKKYLTLFHFITHFIFSQIRKLNFDSCWCCDILYYPTFFIHQNVRTDLTYVWVPFKLKHLIFNC